MTKRQNDESENPPHNLRIDRDPDADMVRLFLHHKRNHSLELFYNLYPDRRPPARDESRERSR